MAGIGTSINYLVERRHNLPARLLALTVVFIIIAEIVVFVPSVAKFRYDYLQERIERAYLISVSFQIAPDNMIEPETVRTLFETAEIIGVRIDAGGRSQLILAPGSEDGREGDEEMDRKPVDLREASPLQLIGDALGNMVSPSNMYLMVQGAPPSAPGMTVDIVIEKAPLREALWRYAIGILGLSIVICIIVAGAIYFTILFIFVRPMVKLTANMARFQRKPEDEGAMMRPSGRRDEIGQAERVLADMQAELRSALRQKSRLATLGEGMSKINHDLRNVLASAMLMSDRLSRSEDPQVKRLAPRLIKALDRAVVMCQATLDYGRAEVKERERVNLFDIVEETSDALKIFTEGEPPIQFINEVSPRVELMADRTQLFRGLFNLARNSAEALATSDQPAPRVTFSAERTDRLVIIDVQDNGPGLPPAAREHLFVPFKGSVRQGGSGLGLAIAAETVRAHGGDIVLHETGPAGTIFRITLPLQAPTSLG
ncbi:sensor histidine kinase [Aquisalinus flavus]|uniref:histidine kinase n=1 Tax=Aquisalinus flavus TaxID=1526572 RepID=A0A8J2V222_9PROT|nr:HAMP domain-containing sensor histidine kinase [Aquisalinus flavus]MBD0426906.1 HAMP domain-containing histidine kinase [Aquisalinus flavus]UNE46750.1 HAMP domain-containing histidine kinase [Aquisalinus flavus]GGC96870.1 ATPase [Aquisalinus flavus]